MKFRVAWIDTDASGRIHFSAPLRWLEATEMGLYEHLGVIDRSIRMPRRHLEVDYFEKLGFGDEIDVRLEVVKVGHTSVGFAWKMLHDGDVAIGGRHTVVHVDAAGRPSPLDDEMRRGLEAAQESNRERTS